jgi:hypothetical protein
VVSLLHLNCEISNENEFGQYIDPEEIKLITFILNATVPCTGTQLEELINITTLVVKYN